MVLRSSLVTKYLAEKGLIKVKKGKILSLFQCYVH